MAVLGAVLGPLAETVHQRAGVWILQQAPTLPWWIGAIYFVALLLAGAGFYWWERRLGFALELSRKAVAVEVGLLVGLFLAPVLLRHYELWFALAASAFVAVRLGWFRARGDVQVAMAVMVANLAIESILVGASLYRYADAQWLALPLWLGPLWAGLGLSLRRLFYTGLVRTARNRYQPND